MKKLSAITKTVFLVSLLVPLFGGVTVAQQSRQEEPQSDNERITISDLKRKMDDKEDILIIDARAGNSYLGSSVRIKGAIHLILDELSGRIDDLPRDKEIVVYCT